MKKNPENFCPVFERLKQLALEKGLPLENTILNRAVCQYAQACLGINYNNDDGGGKNFQFLIAYCQIKNLNPPRRIYLQQNRNAQPDNSQADNSQVGRFFNKLKKTAQLNNW